MRDIITCSECGQHECTCEDEAATFDFEAAAQRVRDNLDEAFGKRTQ